jgi:hypothetical protein
MLNRLPPSRASSLPQWTAVVHWIRARRRTPGGSEPARESAGSVMEMLNVPPSSRAGSLPQWKWCWALDVHAPQDPMWSEPARESAGSVMEMLDVPPSSRAGSLPQWKMGLGVGYACAAGPLWERACSRNRWFSHGDVGCAAAFASRLAPTEEMGWALDVHAPQNPCGSEPARESGGSVMEMLDVPPPSRAGSLPQRKWVGRWMCMRRRTHVGASLLAKAVVLMAQMLDFRSRSKRLSCSGSD